jgi:hypothetical protein
MTCKNQEDQRKFHEILVSVFVPNEYIAKKAGSDVNFSKTTKSGMFKLRGHFITLGMVGGQLSHGPSQPCFVAGKLAVLSH